MPITLLSTYVEEWMPCGRPKTLSQARQELQPIVGLDTRVYLKTRDVSFYDAS